MYRVERAPSAPNLNGSLSCPIWAQAEAMTLTCFHARSSSHRPVVTVRLMYDAQAIYLYFDVRDRYVRSLRTHFQDPVCRDSCVEFFVRPKPDQGYLNFEINAGGTMLLYYISDPTRSEKGGFRKWEPVSWEVAQQVEIHTTLPKVVDPEITEPVHWQVKARIPLDVLESYVGTLGELAGQSWQANFYKCADGTSHPHWASWQPVGERCDFHQPDKFGELHFA